jgi:hypothetical protein
VVPSSAEAPWTSWISTQPAPGVLVLSPAMPAAPTNSVSETEVVAGPVAQAVPVPAGASALVELTGFVEAMPVNEAAKTRV